MWAIIKLIKGLKSIMATINPKLLKEIKKYSGRDFNIDACFNCGNCTAVCPLSTSKTQFPRSLIRYGQVGLKDKILQSDSLWICSYCNDCSDTCPRDAAPGEFVAAARKWAISEYDVTGFAKLFNSSNYSKLFFVLLIPILSLVFVSFIGNFDAITNNRPIKLFDLFDKLLVEILGLFLAIYLVAIIGLSVLKMYINVAREQDENYSILDLFRSPILFVKNLFVILFVEVIGQKKQYDCYMELDEKKSIFTTRWFIHQLIFLGFLGLGLATFLNWIFKEDSNALVPIYHPIRLLGILSGIFFMLGISMAFWNRLRKTDKYSSKSNFDDYFLLVFLWLFGATGFLVTGSLYITEIPASWAYYFFILHLIVVLELFILAPFTKFAHVWFRTFALWIHRAIETKKIKQSSSSN